MIKDFKEFIARGSVVDLAVAVIIGAAFGQIVTSLVNNILMPIIGAVFGGVNFSGFSLRVGDANIMYGNFIQSVVNFLIIAFCIFLLIKVINKIAIKKQAKPAPQTVVDEELEKIKAAEVELLKEIRDLMKRERK
ncbi:large conductance mechanosensitive channel protein MscL [Candidatus Saccharibacteria bacterium]|nr:large conductance mechanosensitive channel protein MscL [Candidatus Saccharibacteria bacterium]